MTGQKINNELKSFQKYINSLFCVTKTETENKPANSKYPHLRRESRVLAQFLKTWLSDQFIVRLNAS